MVISNCKHSGQFELIFCAGAEHYVFRCEVCKVFKLNFSPEQAGKMQIWQGVVPNGADYHAEWWALLYYTKKDEARLLPPLSIEGKY